MQSLGGSCNILQSYPQQWGAAFIFWPATTVLAKPRLNTFKHRRVSQAPSHPWVIGFIEAFGPFGGLFWNHTPTWLKYFFQGTGQELCPMSDGPRLHPKGLVTMGNHPVIDMHLAASMLRTTPERTRKTGKPNGLHNCYRHGSNRTEHVHNLCLQHDESPVIY